MGKTTMIVIALLALLLISGYAVARYKGFCAGPEGRLDWAAKRLGSKLDLNQTQESQLLQFKNQALEIVQDMRDERTTTAEAAIALLDTPQLDREQARRLVQEKQAQLASAADRLVDAFADFSDQLSDTQRRKLQEMIRQHRARSHCHFACDEPDNAATQ